MDKKGRKKILRNMLWQVRHSETAMCAPYCAAPVFDVFPESRDIILSPTAPEPHRQENSEARVRAPSRPATCTEVLPRRPRPRALPSRTPARLAPRRPAHGG